MMHPTPRTPIPRLELNIKPRIWFIVKGANDVLTVMLDTIGDSRLMIIVSCVIVHPIETARWIRAKLFRQPRPPEQPRLH